jgi:hypothetical protein
MSEPQELKPFDGAAVTPYMGKIGATSEAAFFFGPLSTAPYPMPLVKQMPTHMPGSSNESKDGRLPDLRNENSLLEHRCRSQPPCSSAHRLLLRSRE